MLKTNKNEIRKDKNKSSQMCPVWDNFELNSEIVASALIVNSGNAICGVDVIVR